MKKSKRPAMTALYAAPAFFAKDGNDKPDRPEAEEDPRLTTVYGGPDMFREKKSRPQKDESAEYPDSFKEPDDNDRLMNDVYAGPEFFAAKKKKAFRPSTERVYAAPDIPRKKAVRPEADPMIMAVYAGPDFFSGMQNAAIGMQLPQDPAQDENTRSEEPEASAENEDERMKKLMEKFEKEPPVMMGLVQHDPSANPGFLGMCPPSEGAETHSFCCECGAKLPFGFKFCPECGALNEQNANRCRECGAKTEEGQKFCSECGTRLK